MIMILIYHLIVMGQLYLVCRNKTVSIKELVQTFAVGATAAVLGNFLIQGIVVRFIGSHITVYTVGPVAEELIKISFVVFLLFKTRLGKTTSIEDGLLLGAAVGAGYGFTEDAVRAVGLGLKEMLGYFPGYDLKNILTLLTTWLPSEREGMGAISYYNIFIAGHLLWSALAGVGFSIALKLPSRFKWRYLIPIFLLIWVIIDHSLCNNTRSMLRFVHSWYGYGLGIRYVLTAFLILAVIGDELILRRKLTLDESLLIPGEKKRTIFSELFLTLTSWKFGKKYWSALMDYLNIRRQLGFMIYSGEKTENFIEMLKKRRRYVIATAHLLGKHKNLGIPPVIISLWHGPRPNFFKFNLNQKMWWSFMILIIIFGIFNAWLFLFSVYLPGYIVRVIYQSPLFPIFGILGYGVALFELAIFYIKKLWRNPQEDIDDRIKPYSHFVLINSSGMTMIFSLPFFIGQHFLLIDKFLWGQLARFFEFLKEARKWVGGPLSAGIGAIPIVGNVQSGVNAAFGYDYISDEPVEGLDRVMAAL